MPVRFDSEYMAIDADHNLAALQKKLLDAQRAIKSLQQAICIAQARITKTKQKMRELEQKILDVQKAIKSLAQSMYIAQGIIPKLQQETKRLWELLQSIGSTQDKLSAKVAELEQFYDEEINLLKARVSRLEHKLKLLEEK